MAGAKQSVMTSKKLIKALSTKGFKYSLATRQFMGTEGRLHNYYTVNNHIWDDEKRKYIAQEVYSTTSTLRLLFFLRDKWYLVNGIELPNDQEQWNNIRSTLMEEGKL